MTRRCSSSAISTRKWGGSSAIACQYRAHASAAVARYAHCVRSIALWARRTLDRLDSWPDNSSAPPYRLTIFGNPSQPEVSSVDRTARDEQVAAPARRGPSRVSSSDVPREAHTIIEVVASPRAVSLLNCPRCGLSIRPKARGRGSSIARVAWARASIQVELFSSPLPPAELYREGSAPHAERFGVTPTDRTGSRRRVSLLPIRSLR